jgi:DNA replication protein DnaC
MPVDVTDLLRAIGFRTPKETIHALLVDLKKQHASPSQVCERLSIVEKGERDRRNLARRTIAATLGSPKTLDRFDWAWPRSIDRDRFERLSSLDFIDSRHNVLLRGPPGVGKTMLAQNLGLLALQKGYSVCFSTLASALADLLRQESMPALERRIRRYEKPDLLILDELGYLPQDARAADLLYNIIARRHEQASTIITTNLAYKRWADVFPGAACIVALVDRFAQHCQVIDIDADTWRQKNDPNDHPQTKNKARPRRRR